MTDSSATIWLRIFGMTDVQPAPAAILEHLHQLGYEARGDFRGDNLGWLGAQLFFHPGDPPCQLERYVVAEEGIRPELNTWAAWLETVADNPHTERLMVQIIVTKQLFTLHGDDEDGLDLDAGVAVCRLLARLTDGFYQVDGQGLFAADGTLLVAE